MGSGYGIDGIHGSQSGSLGFGAVLGIWASGVWGLDVGMLGSEPNSLRSQSQQNFTVQQDHDRDLRVHISGIFKLVPLPVRV